MELSSTPTSSELLLTSQKRKLRGNLLKMTVYSILVAYYKVNLEENMINRAIKTVQLDFLYCVYAYNKNYEKIEIEDDSEEDEDEEAQEANSPDNSQDKDAKNKYIIFTFDFLFKKILEYCED